MPVETRHFEAATKGRCDMLDVTSRVSDEVSRTGMSRGVATVFVPGSTCGVTTIEYESGALEDLKDAFERAAPEDIPYAHDARWGDGNGHSHVRAAMLGPSLAVPFADGRLLLGTWQQIVLVDFDNRPRTRRIVVSVAGE